MFLVSLLPLVNAMPAPRLELHGLAGVSCADAAAVTNRNRMAVTRCILRNLRGPPCTTRERVGGDRVRRGDGCHPEPRRRRRTPKFQAPGPSPRCAASRLRRLRMTPLLRDTP